MLVLLSGLGLIAVVVFDLRESVEEQDARAESLARRDAERGARELRALLANPEILDRITLECRFRFEGRELVIPAAVRSLDPATALDPGRILDPVAQDLRLRAERADAESAATLWKQLLVDPTLNSAAQAWVKARVAWFAERVQEPEWRDGLIAELDGRAPDEVGVSVLLLCARAGLTPPDWAISGLRRLPEQRAAGVLSRLAELGADVAGEEQRCRQVRQLRQTLMAVKSFTALLDKASSPWARPVEDALLIFFPSHGEGAWLQVGGFHELVGSLTREGLADAPALDLGGVLAGPGSVGGVPLLDGFGSLETRPVLAGGLASGSTGLALLSVALAALCGGGALLALRGARREADAARLHSEFLTGVTHELKTPLAGIRLTADLMLDGHVHEEAARRKHLGRLAGEALRLGVLIDNVLDLGRLERGERGFQPERANVVELVAETLALFDPLAARDGLKIDFEPKQKSLMVDVDRDALRQALLNVLDNARKYGGADGRLTVTLELDRGIHAPAMIRLAVRDYGPGLPAAEREGVFERFRRGARQQDGSVPGVGLGLYLARELLRRHAGDLASVDPPDGGPGACFELTWPQFARGVVA